MTDSTTTLAELRKRIGDFDADGDWSQFHSPKNLAMSIAIEAAELMEHFQWISPEAAREVAENEERLAAVAAELADVFAYTLAMANELGIDLTTALRNKVAKNERKYPAEEYWGRFGPEDRKSPCE